MVNMANLDRSNQVHDLLLEIKGLLIAQDESYWIRGINGALAELLNDDGSTRRFGFENARAVYNSITQGGRGFGEYAIGMDDEKKRLDANGRLDELRTNLWRAFNS
jgi:hypothetical protein